MQKCKHPDHVDVETTAVPGDPVGVWDAAKVYNAGCRNERGYIGDVVVLIHNGKPGMQMFPDLAAVMPDWLRAAAKGGQSAVIKHRVLRIPTAYAILSSTAAYLLAEKIEEVR